VSTLPRLLLIPTFLATFGVSFADDFSADSKHRSQLKEVLNSPGEFLPQQSEKCRLYQYQNGEKTRFHVDINSSFCMRAEMEKETPVSEMKTELSAQSIGNATILETELNLFAAMASAEMPLLGTPSAQAEVMVLGYQVWSDSIAAPEMKYERDFTMLNFEKTASAPFQIGPIPAKVTAGLRARLDTHLMGALAIANARAELTPQLTSGGFVQVAVDALVAEAGVEGNLNLLDETLAMKGAVGLLLDPTPATPMVYIAGGVTGMREFETMNGGVKLFAKFLGQDKGFEREFYNMPGTNGQTQMFDLKFGPTPVFQKYLQLPNSHEHAVTETL
jgi:hypothetical protein